MNLSLLDWVILAVCIVSLRYVSLGTRRYMKGVADFLSANRSAGRYLLTIASAMGTTATVSVIGMFEMLYSAGLPPMWWGFMNWAATAVILLTGWVFYRFRETRALTLAQFFEMRYSRRFRILAGVLGWICGLLNFGIFPAVATHFIIYFCGLPSHFHVPGIPMVIPMFPTVMAANLGLALTFVTMGGQISVMVTECVQGIVSSIAMLIVVMVVLARVQWPKIVAGLSMAPENSSMINPFMTSGVKDFNVWFFLIGVFGTFYCWMAWQGTSGFNSAARSPHEQKMGGIIGVWRGMPLALVVTVLPIAAYAVMHLPEYAAQAAAAKSAMAGVSNEAVRGQMLVPIVMAKLLPDGVRGLLAATMIFFSFTATDTYMHSWSSIFIQDVVMPIRNRSLTPEQHIKFLRWSVVGTALFGFLFGVLYPQTQKIMFFFALTGTVWLGGAGACIIGGLYWKKGTTAAAYTALIYGAVVGGGGLIVQNVYKSRYGVDFPINGQWIWLIAMLGAILLYVVVSLSTCRSGQEHNMDRLLNRGKLGGMLPTERVSRWRQLLGITSEFSLGDRILAYALMVWNFGWCLAFLVITAIKFTVGIDNAWWPGFWYFYIMSQLVIGVPTTVWFTVGGIMDVKALFRSLATSVRDQSDDGSVRRAPEPEPTRESEELVP